MSKKPILKSVAELGSSTKEKIVDTADSVRHLEFLNKKIVIRIHYFSRQVKEYKKKITTAHTFDIDSISYFIVAEAFYRKGGVMYCDYYFNNPQPIIYKNYTDGVAVASSTFKKKLIDQNIISESGEILDYKKWLEAPFEEKTGYAGVYILDGKMVNRAINHNFTQGVWVTEGFFGKKSGWIIFGIIIIAIIITAMIYYFRLRGQI